MKKWVSRWRIIAGILFTAFLYNEWICFLLKQATWLELDQNTKDVRILLVADPQILSLKSEPFYPFSIFTVWDANRYVSKSFKHAVTFSKPDVIVFLGDLLNDGSITNDEEFHSLAINFKKLFQVSDVQRVFYIPGDNDIGGEGWDFTNDRKIRRFNFAFNASSVLNYKHINLVHANIIPGVKNTIEELKSVHPAGGYTIVVSHMSVLPGIRKSQKEALHRLHPSLIFSGHVHESFQYTGSKENIFADRFFVLRDNTILDIDLKDDKLYEIAVPTCSYRMGKRNYGFGLATVSTDGILKYSILWLPCRFPMLVVYLIVSAISLSLVIKPAIFKISECCSQSFNSAKNHNI